MGLVESDHMRLRIMYGNPFFPYSTDFYVCLIRVRVWYAIYIYLFKNRYSCRWYGVCPLSLAIPRVSFALPANLSSPYTRTDNHNRQPIRNSRYLAILIYDRDTPKRGTFGLQSLWQCGGVGACTHTSLFRLHIQLTVSRSIDIK